jgi:hypothetical protein
MVKLIKKIEQASPLCMCKNPNSFDYNDYYKKKISNRLYTQSKNKASCKPDENFKVDNKMNEIYKFSSYNTRYTLFYELRWCC